jgi:galactokinase
MVELPDPGAPGVRPLALPGDRWANYILGVLAGFAREGVRVPPLEIAVASDVPIGAGLSSSAALEVAVATALAEALSAPLFGLPMARLCQEAEREFAGVPCGIMDQIASALGRRGHAMLVDCRTLDVRWVPVPDRAVLLAIDSGVRHRLDDGSYAQRRAEVEAAAAALGVRVLRDADETMVRSTRIDELHARRARHVVREIQRTLLAAGALRNGDLELLGMLMLQSHQSLRDEFAVSTPELDAIVEEARAIGPAGGAFGARLTGGGFGGSAVVLADADRADAVAARISAAFVRRFRRPASALRLTAGPGSAALRPGASAH